MKRNYSISCAANGEYYRISVKREPNGQGGSRFFHDQVQVSIILEVTPPAGEFYLDEARAILLSCYRAVSASRPWSAWWRQLRGSIRPGNPLYSWHDEQRDPCDGRRHIRPLAKRHPHISVATFYSEPQGRDAVGDTHDHSGFISTEWLAENTPLHIADFYLCGPKPFLRAFVGGLSLAGVSPDRIHYEFFGPGRRAHGGMSSQGSLTPLGVYQPPPEVFLRC